MRLWHVDLIPYLPNTQLIEQWRDLNAIYARQDNHIVMNYIYDYPLEYLYIYSLKVLDELENRNINVKSYDKFNAMFHTIFGKPIDINLRYKEHNNEYLHICFHNLKEKYIRGQKDFTKEIFEKLYNFYLTNAKFSVIIGRRRNKNE